MLIRTVIIEDEENSVQVLHEMLRQSAPDIEVCGSAGYVDSAVRLITEMTPHLLFLDVQMADGSGFDVLRKLSGRSFEIIFVTSYNKYAVEAFRFSAIDYLLKPIGVQEFEEALNRVRIRLMEKNRVYHIDMLLQNMARLQGQDRKVSIPTLKGYEFMDMKDILWCSSHGPYTVFHLADNTKITSSRNLGAYEEILCANQFFRIDHNAIINLRFIKSYVKGKNCSVILTSGTELKVSQRRRIDFLKECAGV
jgi:two-component system LytT family response regulator